MLNEDGTKLVRAAVKEWKAISKGREWKSWMLIGAALDLGARESMMAVHTNERKGRPYNEAFSKWCDEAGFVNPQIDPSTRSHLLALMEPQRRLVCEELRLAMSPKERMRINHPSTMLRRVDAHIARLAGLEVSRNGNGKGLSNRVEALVGRLEEAGGGDVDTDAIGRHWLLRHDADEIAAELLRQGEDKARAVASAILNAAEDRP